MERSGNTLWAVRGSFEIRRLRRLSRGSADPRESLRKRRISKLPLTAHKVLPERSIRDLALFVCKGEGVKVAGGRLWLIAQNTNK